jgi:hypothetical protein
MADCDARFDLIVIPAKAGSQRIFHYPLVLVEVANRTTLPSRAAW